MHTKLHLSLFLSEATTIYELLAFMATSGGHFSRPLGMGKLLELVSICHFLNNSEGMTIFGRNDSNTEGMTIIRKE